MLKKLLILSLLLINLLQSQYQISGKVYDSNTNEPLAGANVFVKELNTGTTTNFDGEFTLRLNTRGKFNLKISYVGYKSVDTLIDLNRSGIVLSIGMKPDVVKLGEVEVSGSVEKNGISLKNYVAAKQLSRGIFDGLSYEQIKLTIASTSSELMNKIVGVSVKQGKFVNVRGVYERYNLATLNGSFLPSPEPDQKAFTFDLIPAGLIQEVKVIKTFSPELPGNFGGGIVDIKTIEFSEALSNSLNLSVAGIPDATFRRFFVYGMNRLNAFGPSNITTGLPSSLPEDLSKLPHEQRILFAKDIKNLWNRNTFYYIPNFRMNFLSMGKIPFGGLSYSFGVIYSGESSKRNLEVYEYEWDGSKRFEYTGDRISRASQLTGYFDLKTKFSEQIVGFRGMIVGIYEDESANLRGFQYTDQWAEQNQMSIKFNQRNLYFWQLYGEHLFGDVKINWQGSTSSILNTEPDSRRLVYQRDIDNPNSRFSILLGPQASFKNGGILYSYLKDNLNEVKADVKFPILGIDLRSGVNFWETKRNFKFRLIGVVVTPFMNYQMYYLPPDSIFLPENFKRDGFSLDEYVSGTNRYKAYDRVLAYYLLAEIPFRIGNQRFNFASGLRVENSSQNIYTRDFTNTKDEIIIRKHYEIFPSVELKYSPTHMINVKLSYSQTVNRPELREIAPFAYYDFYSQTTIVGNPQIQRALIFNYDLRAEIFSLGEDMLSIGVFHKHIKSPIEKVIITGVALGKLRTFMNGKFAKVSGLEVEFIKDLKFLKVVGNVSVLKSSVDVEKTETTVERKGRSLQGQPPYLVNLLLVHEKPESRFSASISYNLTGPRIHDVATEYTEDIIEIARHQVDFRFGYRLNRIISLSLSGKNITASPIVLKQGKEINQKITTVASISFGVNVKF
ncbi:MAG: TonB-dependent receptor [Candidatus Kryptonium sp.]|nr:TonB-dependent receptor [Candidatus Kryptonium sp.]MCX7761500.1 TonB-dependent receptor [Candidatus Kryptonium sp.]MDW8109512.1 TonB-dependent receptor [Candidatus Kryptonium sp.]